MKEHSTDLINALIATAVIVAFLMVIGFIVLTG